MKKNNLVSRFLVLAAAIAHLSACGGGGGGGADGGIAGGGTSGTGTGTVSGFGSVIVNGTREFQVNSSTVVTLDDDPSAQSNLKVGMVVNFNTQADSAADLTTGTATRMSAIHQIKGPVTSLNPLRIFGQSVVVTGDTLFDGAGFTSVTDLSIGNLIEVSGFADTNGTVRATLLERKPSIASWKLVGVVSNLLPNDRFSIGGQVVTMANGPIMSNCGSGISNGNTVAIKATVDADVASGGTLDTATEIKCVSGGLSIPSGAGASIKAEIEGLLAVVDASAKTMTIDGQAISYSAGTTFQGGVEADLLLGVKVEVEGTLNTTNRMLTATKIRFRQVPVEVEAPIADASAVSGVTKSLIGISVQINDETRIDVMTGAHQVGVKGYADKNGSVYALEWRDKGSQKTNDVRVLGPASNPVVNSRFSILGVTVDVDSAHSVNPSVTALFTAINAGDALVNIQHGQLQGLSTLINSDIQLR